MIMTLPLGQPDPNRVVVSTAGKTNKHAEVLL